MRSTIDHPQRFPATGEPSLSAAARLALAWLAAALLVGWVWAVQEPARVDLTVVRASPCAVWVDVGRPDRTPVLDLGPVGSPGGQVVAAVPDQGPTWRFRFSSAGHVVDDLVVGRDQLRADGWRITVPPEVADSALGCA